MRLTAFHVHGYPPVPRFEAVNLLDIFLKGDVGRDVVQPGGGHRHGR